MKGTYSDLKCSFCFNNFEPKEIILVFRCKHIIHKNCCEVKEEELFCKICAENPSQKRREK